MKTNFKKSDLKTGMIVKTRGGETALVMLNSTWDEDCIIFNEKSQTGLNGFNEDMVWHEGGNIGEYPRSIDIMKVYQALTPTGMLDRKDISLIWERKEEKPILEYNGIEYSRDTLISYIKNAHKNSM